LVQLQAVLAILATSSLSGERSARTVFLWVEA